MMFQNYAAFPWLTVSENIAFGLDGKNNDEQIKIIDEHLKLAELEDKKINIPPNFQVGKRNTLPLLGLWHITQRYC